MAKAAAKDVVPALVDVVDATEEELDRLCARAAKLALRNTRAFMFHGKRDPAAETGARQVTGGRGLAGRAPASVQSRRRRS